jgi:hypothetical protein
MGVYTIEDLYGEDTLCHHGIKGQKWGVRNYQKPDGTYTEEGKKRYFGAQRQKNINTEPSSGVHTRGKARESSPYRDKNGNPKPIGQSRYTSEFEEFNTENFNKITSKFGHRLDSSRFSYRENHPMYPSTTDDYVMYNGNVTKDIYEIIRKQPNGFYMKDDSLCISKNNENFLEEKTGMSLDDIYSVLVATGLVDKNNGFFTINKNGVNRIPFSYIKDFANKSSDYMMPMTSQYINKKGKTQKIGPNLNDRPKGHDLPKKKPTMSGSNKMIYFDNVDGKIAKAKDNLKKSTEPLTQKYMIQAAKNIASTKGALTKFEEALKKKKR